MVSKYKNISCKWPQISVHALVSCHLIHDTLDFRQDCNGENLLEKLYTNPQRWSFQFQSYIQLTRLQELKAPMKDGANVRLLERSIQSNKYCFIELAKNNKDLCKEEASVLEKW